MSLLVPGLGQIYNGHIVKGAFVFLTAFLIIPYVYGVFDAYVNGRRPARPVLEPAAPLLLPAARPKAPKPSLEVQLTRAAKHNGGSLSVAEAVLATDLPFSKVQKKLDNMARAGYVDIDNHPDTGVVIYRFLDLAA